MDLNEIKKLIGKDGGKVIIVENGKPILVLSSFEDYKAKFLNLEGETLPDEADQEGSGAGVHWSEDQELSIEDLPV